MKITPHGAGRIGRAALALGVLTALLAPPAAHAQAVTAPGSVQQPATQAPPPGAASSSSATDIGRVSTGPEQEANAERVVPNATTSRAAALEEKQEAPNIIEVQPLSEIVKLPDINMAEALQRIPGISLETDSGEGRFINIRGLDSDLNASTYAGVRLPASNPASPFSGGRAVAFDAFPTGIVGGVELTKTLEPDMDAEGLGGSINLVPRTGAEHGGRPFLEADLGGGYEPLRDTPVEHAEFSAGRSFSGGDGIGGLFAGQDAFSAIVTAVFHGDERGIDDLEESYSDNQGTGVPDKVLSDLEFRRYVYHRKRYGAAANFDAKATEATSLYVRLLTSGYLEGGHKHYLVINNLDDSSQGFCTPLPACIQNPSNPNGYLATQAQLQQQTTDSEERIENDIAIIGGNSIFSGFRLGYHTSYAVGTDRFSPSPGSVWTDPNPVPVAYDNNSNADYPTFHTLNGVNPANPANYDLQEIDLGPSYAKDGEWATAIDATIPTGSGTNSGEWKFGLSGRWRHKTYVSTSPVWTPNGTISLLAVHVRPAADLLQPQLRHRAGDRLQFGRGTGGHQPRHDQRRCGGRCLDQHRRQRGRVCGLRPVLGPLRQRGRAGRRARRVHARHLPRQSLQQRYRHEHARDRVELLHQRLPDRAGPLLLQRAASSARLTYATGIARPGFEQITPGASPSASSNASVTVGNPALRPTIGQNLDATLEYYPGNGQIAEWGCSRSSSATTSCSRSSSCRGYTSRD